MTLTPSVCAISLCNLPCVAKSFACASFVAISTLECFFLLAIAAFIPLLLQVPPPFYTPIYRRKFSARYGMWEVAAFGQIANGLSKYATLRIAALLGIAQRIHPTEGLPMNKILDQTERREPA
jgi:hypothetical protein